MLAGCGGSSSNEESTGTVINPPGSGNATIKVVNILPPGQSGYISPQGQATGAITGNPADFGPHIDDQREMYWNSEFKSGGFMDITGLTPEEPKEGVRIYRDAFGVPAVYGDTLYDVWYGAGYALTVDRLFLLDGVRRTARGTLSELTGPADVPADIEARTLTYTEAEYQAIFDGLSEHVQTVMLAYRDGANARITEVLADPTLLPIEYQLLTSLPEPISIADIFASAVLIVRTVAAWGGNEMENVQALQALEAQHGKETARRIFKDVLWVDDRKATVTVPDAEFTNIGTPPSQRAAVFESMADYAMGLPLDLMHGPGTGHAPEPTPIVGKLPEDFKWPADPKLIAKAVKESPRWPDHVQASYHAVISSKLTADGSTLLVNGPQVGYDYPTQLVELEVHGAGYDARGSTVPGLPVVGIGYTDKTAWGLTSGDSKNIDSYIETLGETPNTYIHNGQTKAMDCRDEVIRYRAVDPAAGAPIGPPEFSVTQEVCRTVHGPVVARSADGKLARSLQYAIWMREIDNAEGILGWNRYRSFDEFHESMKTITWGENLMYADADGNIAFYHPGLHPRRDPKGDQRFPLPGDGSFDHAGMLSFEELPKVINPERGWLANWNNKPAHGWGEGVGGQGDSQPAGSESRVVNWDRLLESRNDFTFADLPGLDREIGLHDPRAWAFQPLFLSISGDAGLNPKAQKLLDILRDWDGDHYNPDIDINDEMALDRPGETIFDEMMKTLVDELFKDLLPPDWYASMTYHGRHPHDAKRMENLALKLFDPSVTSIPAQHGYLGGRSGDEVLREVVQATLARLEATYGAATDPSEYRRVHPRDEVCSLTGGVTGPCLSMPHQDRGSWIHLIGFIPK